MIERVVLAHVEAFRLGALTVRPETRELAHDDGRIEVIEPRVMQVLVALVRAGGHALTRDELTEACWEGRVVGEDAINRVMSRLRRVADGIGAGAFKVETLTRVGYRLVATGAELPAPAFALRDEGKAKPDRRLLIAGGVVGLAALGGAGVFLVGRNRDDPPANVASLVEQARNARAQGTAEGSSQALGLRRRVTELAPDYADGWGHLSLSYAMLSLHGNPEDAPAMRMRGTQAARRALALDAGNPHALLALGAIASDGKPHLVGERHVRAVLADHPDNEDALRVLGRMLMEVGRCREAAATFQHAYDHAPPDPITAYLLIYTLLAAERIDDADRAAHEAAEMYPSHFAVWFTRYYLLLYTGRAREALALSADTKNRPTDIADWNFAAIDAVARAMISRRAEDVTIALRQNLALAKRGVGYAENMIQFAAVLGHVDQAFAVADAFFFDRGFSTGPYRYEPERRLYTRLSQRQSRGLFMPATAAMRADRRFERLTEELGLRRYWRDSGTRPDYLSA